MTESYYEKNKARIKRQVTKAWYSARELCIKRNSERTMKEYGKNKKLFHRRHQIWANSVPWVKTYRRILSRCKSNPFYVKRGIKCLIRPTELKEIWKRDKAHLLKNPSVVRIDPKGHYTKDNCRYIELSDNLRLREYRKEVSHG